MWKSSSMCNKGSPTFPLSTSAGEQNHYRKKKTPQTLQKLQFPGVMWEPREMKLALPDLVRTQIANGTYTNHT